MSTPRLPDFVSHPDGRLEDVRPRQPSTPPFQCPAPGRKDTGPGFFQLTPGRKQALGNAGGVALVGVVLLLAFLEAGPEAGPEPDLPAPARLPDPALALAALDSLAARHTSGRAAGVPDLGDSLDRIERNVTASEKLVSGLVAPPSGEAGDKARRAIGAARRGMKSLADELARLEVRRLRPEDEARRAELLCRIAGLIASFDALVPQAD